MIKKCPTCNRTYADETISFCLADGELLSVPYDPKSAPGEGTEPGEPVTEVMAAPVLPTQPAIPAENTPTVTAAVPSPRPTHHPPTSPPSSKKGLLVGGLLLLLAVVGALIAYRYINPRQTQTIASAPAIKSPALIDIPQPTPTPTSPPPSPTPKAVRPSPSPTETPSLTVPTVDADAALRPPEPRKLPYGVGSGGGVGNGPGNGGGNTGGDHKPGTPGGGPPYYDRVFDGKDVTQKARVLSKPEPGYTEDARKNQITGTVVLRVVLAFNGQVTNVQAIKALPYGLTEKAIAAARLMKFLPATKDGHAVSMYVQVEYNFNLY